MATIALYANKVNRMPGLIQDAKKSVLDYKAELAALKNKSLKINQSICNTEDVISSIQASTQTQEEKSIHWKRSGKRTKSLLKIPSALTMK